MEFFTTLFSDYSSFVAGWADWSILILIVVKFLLGVLVSVQKNEFKWFYLGNVFKSDVLKFATYLILAFTFGEVEVVAVAATALVVDLTAGIVKNVAHMFPEVADSLPSSFREPARLRLGNPRNLP